MPEPILAVSDSGNHIPIIVGMYCGYVSPEALS